MAGPDRWRSLRILRGSNEYPGAHGVRYRVIDLWRRTLQRRSQKDGATWERIAQLANDYLPKPCNLHPWPSVRFAVKHSR